MNQLAIVRVPVEQSPDTPFLEAARLPTFFGLASAYCDGCPVHLVRSDGIQPGIHVVDVIGYSTDGKMVVQMPEN